MRYTHLDQIVYCYREAFSLPDYNPRVYTHTKVLNVRDESFTRLNSRVNWLMVLITIEKENYTCFANAMNDQLHIVHEPSEHYDPLKPYEAPPLEERINDIIAKSKK